MRAEPKMIMVILGAGASYDSVSARKPANFPGRQLVHRPPLAQELFLSEETLFRTCLREFPQCNPIIPYLQDLPTNNNLEQELEKLQAESETDSQRRIQLAAIRFYLQYLVFSCENPWVIAAAGVSNQLHYLARSITTHK